MNRLNLPLVSLVMMLGCGGELPQGLRATPAGNGPKVVWDLDASPLPELPFPNDLATRADPSSSTGRRLNIPLRGAVTVRERETRALVNRLEGFSTYGAITVAFDAPLDLANIITRHHKNRAFADDTVHLINVDPASPGYGRRIPLDLGQGSFPEALPKLNTFWSRDPRAKQQSLVFDTTDEDKNGNGVLDPGEDTDWDGYLDRPNVHPAGGDPVDNLVSFYELVTDTLVVRPLIPLEQETRYAVVLTRHLTGKGGEAVRSPWQGVNHARQTAALTPLHDLMPGLGLSVEDVAFAWSFTTQPITRDLEALRAGLYGHGPLARLSAQFPPAVKAQLASSDTIKDRYLVPVKTISDILNAFGDLIKAGVLEITADGKQAVLDSLNNIEYMFAGVVEGPNLLVDSDGVARATYDGQEDEHWRLDRRTGEATYGRHKIPFFCAVPRADRGKAPFPVAVYAHGYSSTQLEALAFAGNLARHGVATCTIDAVAHGLNLEDMTKTVRLGLELFKLGPLFDAVYPGRARDTAADGLPESGADFFSADLFNSRDNLRQTVLDIMVLVRALRGFDGSRGMSQDLDGDGANELAGDFNADGVVDIGGPGVPYYTWGTSLGGITSSIVAGIEPAVVAATPQAMGGGLVDIVRRSTQGAVVNSVLQRLMGPIFLGEPIKGKPGEVRLVAQAVSGLIYKRLDLGRISPVQPGDRVELLNLKNGERAVTHAAKDGGFRLAVAADALSWGERRVAFALEPGKDGFKPARVADTARLGDPLSLTVYPAGSKTPRVTMDKLGQQVSFQGVTYPAGARLVAPSWGYGLPRNSPDLRRMIALGQMIIDPADPINYAPHFRQRPLSFSYDPAVKAGANVLLIASAGDTTVPVAAAVSLARASGAVPVEQDDPRFGAPLNQVLLDNHITEGLARLKRFKGKEILMDPENFSLGKHAPTAPRLKAPLRAQKKSAEGLAALRIPLLAPKGQHGFILPKPAATFDNNTFMVHLVARYLTSGGKILPDEVCMEDESCSWIPKLAAPHK